MSQEFWLLVVLLLRYAPVEATEQSASLKPYEYTYETDKKTWEEAKAACETKGAVLAKVGSDAIKTTLLQFPVGAGAWIGATDGETEGVWKWLADETLIDGSDSYTTWASSQPDNWINNGHASWRDGEDCGTLKGDGTLNDAHCIQNRFGYICQKSFVATTVVYSDMFVFTDVYRLYFSNDVKSWNDAEAYCQTDGSNLAKMDLSELTSLISDKFNSADRWRWIGANRPEGRGEWKWSNGNGVNSPINWRSGEPNGGTNQKCVAVDAEGKWLDHYCRAEIKYICLKRLPTTVSHNGHVFTFHRTRPVNWNAAKTGCASSGSRLVEIYDTATNDVIRNNILNPGQMFYSGGIVSSRTVTWDSGGTARNLPAWASGEPNINGQSKIALSTRGWVDVHRTLTLPYICEMVNMTTITSRQTILTVGVDSDREVTCSADGIPTANVFWKFSSVKVRSSNVEGGSPVYQTEAEGRSILYLEGAKLTDEGTYTCVAEHRAGTFSKTLQKGFILAVPSVPEFVITEVEKCSSNITVKWRANQRAQNIRHRITVTDIENESDIYSFSNLLKEQFSFEARKWKNYNISVTPCPDDTCKEKYTAVNYTRQRTTGLPGMVRNLNVQVSNKYSCQIGWDKPSEDPTDAISGFKVTVKKASSYRPGGSQATESIRYFNISGTKTEYLLVGDPNHEYMFGIQALTCMGFGSIVWSNNSCVTDAAVPKIITKPQVPKFVNENGTMQVDIRVPSQENGQISCLFVIVKVMMNGSIAPDSASASSFLLPDFNQANTSNQEYVAIAVDMNKVGQSFTVTLGNETLSKCQVSTEEKNAFVGRNSKLDQYKDISVFLVTSTPTRDGTLYKAGRSVQVMAIPKPVKEYDVYLWPHEYIFVTEAKIWNGAKQYCTSRRATLARIDLESITQTIKKNLPAGHSEMWIGGKRKPLANDPPARGKNVSHEKRVPGEQRNSTFSSVQAVDACSVFTREGKLKSLPCTKYRRGFVCEKNIIIVDHHRLLFSYEKQTWTKAKAECEHEGMHLVKIDSALLNANISESFVGARWIGASDEKSKGDWRWLDGTTANRNDRIYHNWLQENLTDSIDEKSADDDEGEKGNCAVVLSKGKWKDISCWSERKYICQKSLTVFTDQYKLFFSYYKKNRSQAQAECNKDGSHLIKINSELLGNVIANNSNELRWFGAYYNGTKEERGDGKSEEGNCAVLTANRTLSSISCSGSEKFICQKSLPLAVTHNNHLFTFHRVKKLNWNEARDACRRDGAILAEIYDYATDAAIRTQIINVDAMFFSGGHVNGTAVTWDSGQNVTYSSGWAIEEPNNNNHTRIALTTIGWKDVSSTQDLPYICEMANLTDIKLSHAKLMIRDGSDKMVTCTADGVPYSKVFWKFLQTNVTSNGSGPVYQEKGDGRSVLHVESAMLLDEGKYTCVAENQAGHFKRSMGKSFNLKVPSAPEFVIAQVGKCSSNITVKWKANKRAKNVKHRITVRNINNESDMYRFSDLVKGQFEAKKWEKYKISVTPCPDDSCKEQHTVVNYTHQRTAGLPGKVRNLTVQVSDKYYCQISWDKPSEDPKDAITGFKVTVKKALSCRPGGSQATESIRYFNISGTKREYLLVGDPNHEYMFGIQALTCMGFGSIVWSNNSCVTDAAAPNNIAKPQVPKFVNENGTMQVDIHAPSQENGQISCLFVIVKVMMTGSIAPDSASAGSFLLPDLNQASTSNEEFVAVAVDMNKVEESLTVTLGNQTISKCKISTKEKNTLVGRNLKLDQYRNISVFLVTSTPTREEILFKASESVQVMAVPKPVKDYDVYLKPHEYIFVSEAKIWNDAKQYCKSQRATLAEIDSESITQFIKKNLPVGHSEMWIAATEIGNLKPSANDTLARRKNGSHENRVPGEQQNSTLSNVQDVDGCSVFTREGKVKSLPCTKHRRGFVCEKNIIIVDHHHLLFSYNKQTWAKAKAECEHEGMHLVKIDSDSLNANISDSFVGARWIGASDEKSKGDWRWLDGTTANRNGRIYHNWITEKSDDNEGKKGNCAVILGKRKWKDLSCSSERKYICQKSLVVFTDQYKLFFSYFKKNRSQAQAECNKAGSHLIKIDSERLKNVIAKNSNELRWFGAYYNATEEEWKRGDGQCKEGNCAVLTANRTLSIVSCAGSEKFICQKSLPLAVTHNNHLFTFHRVKKLNWNEAREACRTDGAILAEIYDNATDAAIRTQIINVDAMFFSGGHVNGTAVTWDSGQNVTYSSGWAIEEPNNNNHTRIALTTIGWKDVSSTRNLPYICEMANLTDIKLSHAKLMIRDGSDKMVTCTADGVPFSKVFWKYLQTNVTSDGTGSVYQEKGDGRSVLHVGTATLLDEGMYTCVAENQAGNFKKSIDKSFNLKVPSAPKFAVIEASICSPTIHVNYNPNSKAQNVKYRITVTDAENRSSTFNLNDHLKKNRNGTLHFPVPKWKLYNVTVTPCPKNVCKDEHSITNHTSHRTAGLPAKVESVRVWLSNKYTCRVDWEKPTEDPKEFLTKYKVIVTQKLSYGGSTATESVNETLVDRDNTTYSVLGKPNSQYNFGIQAKTCAGLGNITWLNDSCVTDTKEPEFVAKPQTITKLISDGKMKITVAIPSQANGRITCIFVIVEVHGPESKLKKSQSSRSYNWNDLIQANATNETTHLALALDLKSVPGNMLNETIGDERTTTCEFSAMAKRSKRATNNNVFIGQNLKLDPYKTTMVFIVTGTPTANGILLKASEDIQIKAIPKESRTTITTIAAAVVGAIFVLLLLVVIVLWVKRRRGKAENRTVTPVESAYASVGEGAMEMTAVTTRQKTCIPMNEFEATYNSMHQDQGAAFTEQFEKLVEKAKSLPLSVQFASKPELKAKNRYKNILPFDNTRVCISHNSDEYINACFIDGFEQKKKYIATQGPLLKTVDDFWLMIVEQKVTSIVMLAKCLEAGKKKCEKYWPDIGQTSTYRLVTVSNINETRSSGFVCRSLRVKAKLKSKHETAVTQYHFLTWPDHGFPLTTSHILRMHRKLIDDRTNSGSTSPIVVHCSAGAGRTGTFIGYDYLLNESKSVGNADVFECVLKMRKQRVQMVQNCDQFILVHKLLLETHILHDTDISRQEVLQTFSVPRYKTKVAGEEFANLSRVQPMNMSERGAGENISAYERMRVKMFENESEIASGLNASFVEAYDDDLKIIVARQPSQTQIELLWKLSFNLDINTIVMISENEDNPLEYWSFCPERENFTVHVDSEDASRKFTIRKLKIQGAETKFITHLHLRLNSSEATRRTVSTINDCVDRLQKELRESHGAALVHCKSGTGMSGVFCAMMNILERLAAEDRVDVFRAVKDLRDCKEGMVETQEQYELCYEGVIEYLRNFDTYSNFM